MNQFFKVLQPCTTLCYLYNNTTKSYINFLQCILAPPRIFILAPPAGGQSSQVKNVELIHDRKPESVERKKWIRFWNLIEIVGKCCFYTTYLNVVSKLNEKEFYKMVFRIWFLSVLSMIWCSRFVFTRLSYWVISILVDCVKSDRRCGNYPTGVSICFFSFSNNPYTETGVCSCSSLYLSFFIESVLMEIKIVWEKI